MGTGEDLSKEKWSEVTTESFLKMYEEANKINAAFLQGRIRLDEMADAVTRTAAGVVRLGGRLSDVGEQISKISQGSKRNFIATEETVSKLYSASQLLEMGTETIVENFGSAGVEASIIGENIENSFRYIQSIGLNAKIVMTDVVTKMDLMNKFSFSNGVEGFTKMAARASMLRFDMQKTADFAEKVITPEGAIEAAAGFQRLGVTIGNLVDPFALLNNSLTDPGALQDSIIEATKQFTEFDEKTKTFKINPQGILMLREMQQVTGIQAAELSKAALAAADLDRRLSFISPSIDFENEEDKMLLANMATMRGGEYVVQIQDDKTGIIEQRKLSEITQEEFKLLRKKQEEAPKSLEEIQMSQLTHLENMDNSLRAIAAKGSFGLAGAAQVRGNILGAERISRALFSTAYDRTPESATITENINNAFKRMADLYDERKSGRLSETELRSKILEIEDKIKESAESFGDKGKEEFMKIIQQASEKISGNSDVERAFKSFASGEVKSEGKGGTTSKSLVDFSGTINFKFDTPSGISEQQFKTYFETEEFRRMIYKYYEEKTKELEMK